MHGDVLGQALELALKLKLVEQVDVLADAGHEGHGLHPGVVLRAEVRANVAVGIIGAVVAGKIVIVNELFPALRVGQREVR